MCSIHLCNSGHDRVFVFLSYPFINVVINLSTVTFTRTVHLLEWCVTSVMQCAVVNLRFNKKEVFTFGYFYNFVLTLHAPMDDKQ